MKTLCLCVLVSVLGLGGCMGRASGEAAGGKDVRIDGCLEVRVVGARTSITRGQNLEILMVSEEGDIRAWRFPAHSFTANESRIMRAIQKWRQRGSLHVGSGVEDQPGYAWAAVAPPVRLLVPPESFEGGWNWGLIERWSLDEPGG
jgi:hypothetical protein